MIELFSFNTTPSKKIKGEHKEIHVFEDDHVENIDREVVDSFGEEWEKFYNFSSEDIELIGKEYFGHLSPEMINKNTTLLDVGCGTGRWTKYMSSKVKSIEAIDPSKAIFFADKLLKDVPNVRLSMASTDNIPFEDESFDFVMSVGVLHHIPDTQKAMMDCVKKVKKGGFFYVYLYYAFDNRGPLFKAVFQVSDIIRKMVSSMPSGMKKLVCDLLAVILYMPFVLTGRLISSLGFNKFARKIPLSNYQDKSFFVIRNDSLDRFGTKLEQRFTRVEIKAMMEKCGLVDIVIPNEPVYWTAVGKKI